MSLERHVPVPPPLPVKKQLNNTHHEENNIERTIQPGVSREEIESLYVSSKEYIAKECQTNDFHGISVFNPKMTSVIQEGPTCGIVSLLMAGRMLGFCDLTMDSILIKAKEMNLTKQGEMFSVQYLKDLSDTVFGNSINSLVLNEMDKNLTTITEHLIHGWPVLVPYDADGNHAPCLKSGKKAHWAVVFGFLGILGKDMTEDTILTGGTVEKEYCDMIYNLLCPSYTFVYAKQGKSRFTKLWSFKRLVESNANLNQVGDSILQEKDNYVLPREPLSQTLASQVLLLRPRDRE